MNIARSIIARFGGNRPMGLVLGLNEATVRGWGQRGLIPAKNQPQVLAAGQALDPPLLHQDFFPPTEETTDAAPQKERSRSAAAD